MATTCCYSTTTTRVSEWLLWLNVTVGGTSTSAPTSFNMAVPPPEQGYFSYRPPVAITAAGSPAPCQLLSGSGGSNGSNDTGATQTWSCNSTADVRFYFDTSTVILPASPSPSVASLTLADVSGSQQPCSAAAPSACSAASGDAGTPGGSGGSSSLLLGVAPAAAWTIMGVAAAAGCVAVGLAWYVVAKVRRGRRSGEAAQPALSLGDSEAVATHSDATTRSEAATHSSAGSDIALLPRGRSEQASRGKNRNRDSLPATAQRSFTTLANPLGAGLSTKPWDGRRTADVAEAGREAGGAHKRGDKVEGDEDEDDDAPLALIRVAV
ncbi:hypothetical protein HK405_003730 [Cladochytrium tenue]|nr:hypothetical protein HK405_003730 [Cladochytrium tenue]